MTPRLLARQALCALPLFLLLALAGVASLICACGRWAFEQLADMASAITTWMET